MINCNVNQRVFVTLPRFMVSNLNRYCVKYGYVRLSDVVRQFIEDSAKYQIFLEDSDSDLDSDSV